MTKGITFSHLNPVLPIIKFNGLEVIVERAVEPITMFIVNSFRRIRYRVNITFVVINYSTVMKSLASF